MKERIDEYFKLEYGITYQEFKYIKFYNKEVNLKKTKKNKTHILTLKKISKH